MRGGTQFPAEFFGYQWFAKGKHFSREIETAITQISGYEHAHLPCAMITGKLNRHIQPLPMLFFRETHVQQVYMNGDENMKALFAQGRAQTDAVISSLAIGHAPIASLSSSPFAYRLPQFNASLAQEQFQFRNVYHVEMKH